MTAEELGENEEEALLSRLRRSLGGLSRDTVDRLAAEVAPKPADPPPQPSRRRWLPKRRNDS